MSKSAIDVINEDYDSAMHGQHRFVFDKIGFFNIGYWKGLSHPSVEFAQINLIETLVSFFARKQGSILDVACGKGASTKFLTKYFHPQNITGINISEKQLQVCRAIAPECTFRLMDATKLDIPDHSIDNILCIEAAHHFLTRNDFFSEAYRVLTRGGRLAMADIVVHNYPWPETPHWPKENYLPTLEDYRDQLLRNGFRHVRVEDSTEFSIDALRQYRIKMTENELEQNQDYAALDALMEPTKRTRWATACMTYAIK